MGVVHNDSRKYRTLLPFLLCGYAMRRRVDSFCHLLLHDIMAVLCFSMRWCELLMEK